MKRIVTALCCLLPAIALAAPVTIEYQLPTQDCDNQPIGEILEAEFYVSASPIPASDTVCPAPGEPVDTVPTEFSARLDGTGSNGALQVELIGGVEYFVRGRVATQAIDPETGLLAVDENGDPVLQWSNLSNQISFAVPERPGKAPILIRIGF